MLEVAVEGQRRAERAAEGKGGKRSGFDGKEEGPGLWKDEVAGMSNARKGIGYGSVIRREGHGTYWS